jgi:chaperonin GroES
MTNNSGIMPTEYRVLIKPKSIDEKTKGGIILPDETKERNQFAQMEGELVAVSPLAFTYANEHEWAGASKPKPGDRVLFAKYAGAVVKGNDGADYRLINDKDISAVLA